MATVRTVDGQTVKVLGTPAPAGITSVDRSYAVGATYEFHPVNDAEPYEDNACTATERLSGGDIPTSLRDGANAGERPPRSEGGTSAEDTLPESDRGDATALGAVAVAGVAVSGAGGLWMRRRRAGAAH